MREAISSSRGWFMGLVPVLCGAPVGRLGAIGINADRVADEDAGQESDGKEADEHVCDVAHKVHRWRPYRLTAPFP